ncbi:PAS domain S-box protein [Maridesulfovibrio sp.]|uniref:PAS domain S-box protein n=1 Tax=Maridesulfovibrio sp. TaxID=2795000 RepID=UPI0039F147CE
MKYAGLSKEELIAKIKSLEALIKSSVCNGADSVDIQQGLSLSLEELAVQDENLKKTQFDLDRNVLKYFELFEYAPVGYILLDSEAIILEANITFSQMLGHEREHLINTPLSFYLAKDFISYPAMITEWVAESGRAEKTVKLQPKDGNPVWVQLIISANGFADQKIYSVAVQDISRLVEAEARLEGAYSSVQIILDNIPSIVGIINENGKIELVNKSWHSFTLEYYPAIADCGVGSDFYEFCKLGFASELVRNRTAFASFSAVIGGDEDIFEFECPYYSKGQKGWFHMRAGRYVCKDGPKVVVTFDDISEVKDSHAKISEERDRFEEILSALDTGLRVIKPDMTIGWVNAKTREMFSAFDSEGQKCHKIFGADANFCKDCATRKSFDQDCSSTSVHFHPTHKKWFSVYTVPIHDADGKVIRVLESVTDISQQKKMELHLKQSEYRYRSLFKNNSVAMFLVNPDNGDLIDVNKAAERLYGWSRADMQKMSIYDINTASRENLEMEIKRNLSLDKNTFYFQHRDSWGNIHDVEIHSGPIMIDGRKIIHSSIIDITDRKKNELELMRLRRSVENSFASVVITDKGGNIVYVNPAFSKVTGYSREESIGKNTRVLKSGAHPNEFYRGMWRTIARGNTWKGEICNRKKDGTLFWEQATISPVMDTEGNLTNYVAVKDDITERKELERLKEDVERIMHHDLKNPLNGIIGLPEILLMDDDLSDEHKKILEMIKSSGYRMLRMIDSSLNLFKMENGTYKYIPQVVDLVAVLATLCKDIESKSYSKKLEIVMEGNTSSPLNVLAEHDLLYILFSNLLVNAVEASPKGEKIIIDLPFSPDRYVKIINRGVVPQQVRHDFFDKYKTHGKKGGTGIGTYSSKLTAGTMGYSMEMFTSDEKGTTIIEIGVVLP